MLNKSRSLKLKSWRMRIRVDIKDIYSPPITSRRSAFTKWTSRRDSYFLRKITLLQCVAQFFLRALLYCIQCCVQKPSCTDDQCTYTHTHTNILIQTQKFKSDSFTVCILRLESKSKQLLGPRLLRTVAHLFMIHDGVSLAQMWWALTRRWQK